MEDKTKLAVWSMTLIALLEAIALSMGVDGALFGLVIAGIAGLGGYEVAKKTQ